MRVHTLMSKNTLGLGPLNDVTPSFSPYMLTYACTRTCSERLLDAVKTAAQLAP
jgi:hypothetical protein